jgi:hypothetical protein
MTPYLLSPRDYICQLNSQRLIKDTPAIYLQQNQRITLCPLCPSRGYPFIICHLFCLPLCLIRPRFSLLVVCQTGVRCSWIIVFRVLSGVPSLLVLSNSHSFKICPPPLKPETQEYSWLSLLAPLRFMCSPSLPKSQFSTQLFGSTTVTPNVFAIQSYLLFNAPIRRHDTSLCRSTPLRTNLDWGN